MINKDKTPIYKVYFGEKPITNTIVVENSNVCEEPRLETLYITENGTYIPNEDIDGYNEVIVETTGGGVDIGDTTTLNVTENGVYISQYTKLEDLDLPDTAPSGYYPDGIPFYGYAEGLRAYSSSINPELSTRLEFWFVDNEYTTTQYKGSELTIVGGVYDGNYTLFGFSKNNTTYEDYNYQARIGWGSTIKVRTDKIKANEFNHIIMSVAEGLWVNGEKIGDFDNPVLAKTQEIIIGSYKYAFNYKMGMVKINDTLIIPTPDGFLNTETNELLTTSSTKKYKYIEEYKVPTLEGDPYRTVKVNIQPKINLQETGIRFAYSTIAEVPKWADWDGITDMSYMFYECKNITSVPEIDTSNVTNMKYLFTDCGKLKSVPLLDFSRATDLYYCFQNCSLLETIPLLNTSNVTTFYYCFDSCYNLKTIPQIDTSSATDVGTMFRSCISLQSLPLLDFGNVNYRISYFFGSSDITTLTQLGGFKNLKIKWNDGNGLNRLPNLTYQSCINILNELYDFTGNGETPTSSQAQLKVHQNFLDLVGDEISIGTNKGWTITK